MEFDVSFENSIVLVLPETGYGGRGEEESRKGVAGRRLSPSRRNSVDERSMNAPGFGRKKRAKVARNLEGIRNLSARKDQTEEAAACRRLTAGSDWTLSMHEQNRPTGRAE